MNGIIVYPTKHMGRFAKGNLIDERIIAGSSPSVYAGHPWNQAKNVLNL
jgi:hypothetical protein